MIPNVTKYGFANEEQFHRMIASVDLEKHGAAFQIWREEDGTKAGLVALGATEIEALTLEELYAHHESDAAGFIDALTPWRETLLGELTEQKFNELSDVVTEKVTINEMSEIDALASVVLSTLANMIAGKQVDAQIKAFLISKQPAPTPPAPKKGKGRKKK